MKMKMALGGREHSSVRTERLLLHRTWLAGELLGSFPWAWEKVVMAVPSCNKGALWTQLPESPG